MAISGITYSTSAPAIIIPDIKIGPSEMLHPPVASLPPTKIIKCHKSYSTGLPEASSPGQSNWNEDAGCVG